MSETSVPSIPALPVHPPRLIAICGNPLAGKSEAQKILNAVFGYRPVDDGHVLREFAVKKLGLSWEDVETQVGKRATTKILGKEWINRDILGTFGKQLEDMFGEHIMPFIATRNLDPGLLYSFGSVRKTQAQFYKTAGGVVIEIRNPDAPPSPFAFDWFDPALVDVVIENDALSRGYALEDAKLDLHAKLIAAVSSLDKTAL